jgi:hypothetical protein
MASQDGFWNRVRHYYTVAEEAKKFKRKQKEQDAFRAAVVAQEAPPPRRRGALPSQEEEEEEEEEGTRGVCKRKRPPVHADDDGDHSDEDAASKKIRYSRSRARELKRHRAEAKKGEDDYLQISKSVLPVIEAVPEKERASLYTYMQKKVKRALRKGASESVRRSGAIRPFLTPEEFKVLSAKKDVCKRWLKDEKLDFNPFEENCADVGHTIFSVMKEMNETSPSYKKQSGENEDSDWDA